MMVPARRKALVLAAAMGGSAALAVVGKPTHKLADDRPPMKLEAIFPERFGEWQLVPSAGALVRPSDETGKLYGIYDQVLERVYFNPRGETVMLSVAYGTEQSVGLQVHRPEVCYPGGGFKISQLERRSLPIGGLDLPVTRMLAVQPGRSEPITYWTVLGDQAENDNRAFRWRQISFGLRGQILDGMLVRVSTLDTQVDRAWAIQARFADALVAAVPTPLRVRVVGKPPTP
ncbi:MAG: exosortase-associated protein EpsI, B-type [Rhizobacter sp.]